MTLPRLLFPAGTRRTGSMAPARGIALTSRIALTLIVAVQPRQQLLWRYLCGTGVVTGRFGLGKQCPAIPGGTFPEEGRMPLLTSRSGSFCSGWSWSAAACICLNVAACTRLGHLSSEQDIKTSCQSAHLAWQIGGQVIIMHEHNVRLVPEFPRGGQTSTVRQSSCYPRFPSLRYSQAATDGLSQVAVHYRSAIQDCLEHYLQSSKPRYDNGLIPQYQAGSWRPRYTWLADGGYLI